MGVLHPECQEVRAIEGEGSNCMGLGLQLLAKVAGLVQELCKGAKRVQASVKASGSPHSLGMQEDSKCNILIGASNLTPLLHL